MACNSPEDHRDTGDDHLIMGVPGLVQHLQRALLAVLQVLEADIAQGRTPLLQDEEETIRFHQIECMKTIRGPQEVLHKIVAVITIPDHILRDMKMLVEMAMASKKSAYESEEAPRAARRPSPPVRASRSPPGS
ncbi:hypothetical protein Goshw_025977, partial [Gossypium schwendimanii]|nr:hypothetical protein [Gossypium schwendimanii]